jgi:hypothetical protein
MWTPDAHAFRAWRWSPVLDQDYVSSVAAMLIAKFVGDIAELTSAYDRAHALIGQRGGATRFGELRHHCATSDEALYIIGVWESADQIRQRWSSEEMRDVLTSVGFPAEPTELTILDLHVIEPAL